MLEEFRGHAARRRRHQESGFTLIELLVVIAVLAILALIVIFNVTGVTNRGSSAQCATDLHSVQTASDAYQGDHQKYATAVGGGAAPGTLVSTELVPYYLHTWPTEKGWTIDANGTVNVTCP